MHSGKRTPDLARSATRSRRETLRRAFLPELTGVRFLAAFWVLGFHTIPRTSTADSAWNRWWESGYAGVTLFFVLSGFILVYTYGPAEGERIDRRTFWVARFARVYPAYAAALLFALPDLLRQVLKGAEPLRGVPLLSTLVATPLMLQAWLRVGCQWNCPGWSISTEAFFYLLFPLLAFGLRSRTSRELLWLAACAALLCVAGARLRDPMGLPSLVTTMLGGYSNPIRQLPNFLLGMVAGRAFLDGALPRRLARPRAASVMSALVAAVAAATVLLAGLGQIYLNAALAPLFALLILGQAASTGSGVLARPAMVLLGEASYALYLLHGPMHGYVLAAANRILPGGAEAWRWPVFFMYVVACLAASLALYRLWEEPARRRIRARLS